MIRTFNPKDRGSLDMLMLKLQKHFTDVDTLAESLPFKDIKSAHSYMQQMIDDVDSMGGVIYVADESDGVIGFAQGVIINHAPGDNAVFYTTHGARKDGWIGLIFVEPEHRGGGIGRSLIDAMKEYFKNKGCDTIRLLVLSGNAHAIDIYRQYGFEPHEFEMAMKIKK